MSTASFSFGRFEVHPAQRQLLLDGVAQPIGARAFDLLHALIERRERIASKRELLSTVWDGFHVNENNLAVQIAALRKVLGPTWISTVPGRGYRFVAADRVPANGGASDAATGVAVSRSPRWSRSFTPLYGRQQDKARLGQALSAHRLVTLAGIGGVGKSHLAQHALQAQAQPQAQGVLWVELAQLSAPEFVIGTLAAAADVPLRGVDPLETLVAGLRSREVLIGIDNAEHLIDEIRRVVAALLDGTRRVSVLVTSQTPLGLMDEQVIRLGPLALPSTGAPPAEAMRCGAVELFVRRAQEVDMRFELQPGNVAAVIDICQRLDGLPLALELAAARMPLLRLAGLAAMLSEPMGLLASGKRLVGARHRALRMTLEWSHDLLAEREQVAFRRLAAFAGGCSLDMADAVLAANPPDSAWAALDALTELVERSLVEADGGDPPRYRLLETSRAYALDRLEAAGEAPAVRERHARVVVACFVGADRRMAAGQLRRDEAIEMLWPEIGNARVALAWTLEHAPQLALELVPVVVDLFKGMIFAEARRMWATTLPLLHGSLAPSVRARWVIGYAHFWANRDIGIALHWASHAVELYSDLEEPARLLRALYVLAGAKARSGLPIDSELTRIREMNCADMPAAARFMQVFAQGVIASQQGNIDTAVTYYEQALPLSAQMGDREGHAAVLLNLADADMAIGRLDNAIRHGEALVASLRPGRWLEIMAAALHNLAAALIATGRLPEARQVVAQGLPLASDHSLTAEWANHLALLASLEQRHEDAALLLGYGDTRYEQRGSSRNNNEAVAAARAEALARSSCGDIEFDSARGRGRELSDEQLQYLALRGSYS
jgi:predicted ATPase/DNA-binding winged helix-turn-helix (wHTH) protein